ncbi:atherin-like [Iris pallida]|uniref:Atherin-like n=1 Tax=Iris pallida TaxID=29817 RepID=A0AAX6F194_IRIPA|nr:atherin-like [Iris pallida]
MVLLGRDVALSRPAAAHDCGGACFVYAEARLTVPDSSKRLLRRGNDDATLGSPRQNRRRRAVSSTYDEGSKGGEWGLSGQVRR